MKIGVPQLSIAALAVILPIASSSTWAQRPANPNPPGITSKPRLDKEAMGLLRRMVKAEVSTAYIAREATIRVDGPGAEHLVKRDPRQGIRRESLPPPGMVFLDNFKQCFRFNQRGGPVTSGDSFQGKKPDKRWQDLTKRVREGGLSAEVVGQDTVAGRQADIVEVSAANIPGSNTRRFWIDRETGLRLRTEEKDSTGRVLSGSYYLSLDLTPRFRPDDFMPPGDGKGPHPPRPPRGGPMDRQRFPSVAEAEKAGFTVAEPSYLPSGYTLKQVEAARDGEHIALRYGNGLNTLSVMTLKRGVPPRVKPFLRDHTAFVPFPEGRNGFFQEADGGSAYLLIGDLPESELRRIAASLK